MSDIPFFDSRAAFAMRVSQFATQLYDQMESCLEPFGVGLPGYATSIVHTLFHGGPQSISELAQGLALSHQLASQRIKWLTGEGLVTVAPGSRDRRVRVVTLTPAGRLEAEKLQEFLPMLLSAYSDLFDEIGRDAHQTVLDASAALETRSLSARFPTAQAVVDASSPESDLPLERSTT